MLFQSYFKLDNFEILSAYSQLDSVITRIYIGSLNINTIRVTIL